ncbi:MAG: alpha/beta hydrolase [Tatlockia sp.]|nr:alpha/beta hydrolase [Tatlockia sp.]
MQEISDDCLFTQSGARLNCFINSHSKTQINWLLIPSPGLSSDSLTELAQLLGTQIDDPIWLLDYPNDGSNISKSYNFANWHQALIEALIGLDHPVVVAHSTGGMMVQSINELEQLASGLILLDSAPDMEWKENFNLHIEKNLTPDLEICSNIYASESSDNNLRNLLIASLKFSFMPESLNRAKTIFQRLAINNSAVAWSDENFDASYKAKLKPRQLPTLIIAGEHDQIIPLTVYSSNPDYHRDNISLQLINRAGHFPWIDNPEDSLKVILSFKAKFNL